ncbi:MAG: hypothetical protein M0Z56_00275 [Desulfobacteraceae bacterium]|nr:hypothetical protein [Desulfobacteraceae bacterium]
MKKLVLILALMIIPCSAFGLEMLNDNTMDGITGQSGVTIAFDDIQLFINIDTMAYIDCDGLTTVTGNRCTAAGGAVGIQNFQIDVLNINAIVSSTVVDTSYKSDGTTVFHSTNQTAAAVGGPMGLYSVPCGDIPLFYNYANTATTGSCYLSSIISGATNSNHKGLDHYTATNNALGATQGFKAQGLTIDVTDALPAATAGWKNNYAGVSAATLNGTFATITIATTTVGGVFITLPTCEIYINSMILTPFYTGMIGTQSSHAANDVYLANAAMGLKSNFGTFELDGITLTVLSGWLEIAPH